MKLREPKYTTVVNWVRDNIISGAFKVGERLPSEHELSERFGLSRQTVRHAIEVLEQQRLVTRKQGSGTYIGESTRAGRRQRCGNIAVISTYVDSYIFPPVLRGIEGVLSAEGYTTQIAFTSNRISREGDILRNLIEREAIDGLVVEPAKSALPNPNIHYYRKFMEAQIPILFFNSSYPELGLPCVALDDVRVARKAADYLVRAGHRKIGGIFKSDDGQGHFRYSGFLESVLTAGIKLKSRNVVWIDTDDFRHLEQVESYLFYRLEGCTAVLCYNDELAYLLAGFCQKRGIRVPEDLSIISIDNSDLATMGDVHITSFPHPMERLGKKVGENMVKMIENPYFDGTWLFDSEVVEGDSVKRLKVDNNIEFGGSDYAESKKL